MSYEVVGPNGELYGRYESYPTKEQIPLYAMVKDIGGLGQQKTPPAWQGPRLPQEDNTGIYVGLLGAALILGTVIYNVVSRGSSRA